MEGVNVDVDQVDKYLKVVFMCEKIYNKTFFDEVLDDLKCLSDEISNTFKKRNNDII